MPMFPATSTATRFKLGLAAIGLFAVGGAGGGAVSHAFGPSIEMAPMHVVAIRSLASSNGIVTIKGRIAEVFGSRIVVDDGTGRTLIDGGPRHDDDALAPLGSAVAVQGRFDHGTFHPSFLIDASGSVTPVGPPPGHHPDRPGRTGPREDEAAGPDQGPPAPGSADLRPLAETK